MTPDLGSFLFGRDVQIITYPVESLEGLYCASLYPSKFQLFSPIEKHDGQSSLCSGTGYTSTTAIGALVYRLDVEIGRESAFVKGDRVVVASTRIPTPVSLADLVAPQSLITHAGPQTPPSRDSHVHLNAQDPTGDSTESTHGARTPTKGESKPKVPAVDWWNKTTTEVKTAAGRTLRPLLDAAEK
ncbi:hypothetical protein L873DRAFT_636215 [Choiromyces venosus 120613-1]|uniref:Uncharacterized protein n=1 Tax=Choiromyces venosus 120613-1 TaxID=1336337 RepID=A0A3N4JTV1_9PEZI|nr:hypothetical protein L873DRAFT_636215 [Choiromyces venosus 120613-1]